MCILFGLSALYFIAVGPGVMLITILGGVVSMVRRDA